LVILWISSSVRAFYYFITDLYLLDKRELKELAVYPKIEEKALESTDFFDILILINYY
jgi:hypothetical protein